MQLYQLQTENDEEETWKDLVSVERLLFDECSLTRPPRVLMASIET